MADYVRIAREKARAGGLPWLRQLREMTYYFVRHGLGPGYYLMARFWRPEMAAEAKKRHWNGKRYLRFVHRINDPRYYKVSQNKLVEKALLRVVGLPTAPLLGLFQAEHGRTVHGAPFCTLADLQREFASRPGTMVFCKPAEGDSGRGVFAVRLGDAVADGVLPVFDPVSNAQLAPEELMARLASAREGYVIEEAIVQHPGLARFNASSVNTLRIWVVADDRGPAHVAGAFLRIGRAGSLVDNTSAGGLACPIDLESGLIREALDLTLRRNTYERHPDSQEQLIGSPIPFWAECKALACEALRVLPGARFAGMDIAVTAEGPCVVEYNVEPSQQGASHFDRPHGEIFAGFAHD